MASIPQIPDDSGLRQLRTDNSQADITQQVGAVAPALPVYRSSPGTNTGVLTGSDRRKMERRRQQRRHHQQNSLIDTRSGEERRNQLRRKSEVESINNRIHYHIDIQA